MSPHLALSALLCVAVLCCSMQNAVARNPVTIPIFPAPKSFKNGDDTAVVIPSSTFFQFQAAADGGLLASDAVPKVLSSAFARYQEMIFPRDGQVSDAWADKVNTLRNVRVVVKDVDESHPQLGHDESYTLSVTKAQTGLFQGTITAETVWGALHGLESFSQMVTFDMPTKTYLLQSLLPLSVVDEPRFQERGLMLDTSRHFHAIPSIKKLLTSLPMAKINVFHWHIVDKESFPYESKVHPKLWNGAYSNEERYTQEDVKEVVEFARMLGIRVVVEFDMPGHGDSWCIGYPELCPKTSAGAVCVTPLNVAKTQTFDFLHALFVEVTGGKPSSKGHPAGLFPDNLIHLGGDEVGMGCWDLDPEVMAWKQAKNFTDSDAFRYFVSTVNNMVIEQGRRPVQWIEVYELMKTRLPKESIVHVWKSKDLMTEPVQNGYNTILSDPVWYLDHLDVTWDQVYVNEPCEKISDAECKLVLGGHGEMWSERVDDSDLFSTVWPKLGAIAERLWSEKSVNNVTSALPRLQNFRCLLNQRGIGAAPVLVANGRMGPPIQLSCYVQ